MEHMVCERPNCRQPAYRYCFNCEAMLCRLHTIADVNANSGPNDRPRHFYANAHEFAADPRQFQYLYCECQARKILVARCINCLKFACTSCPPEMCPQAAGIHHDYNPTYDIIDQYRERTRELQLQLHKMQEIFSVQLEEACKKLDETEANLAQMINKIDNVIESQIRTIRNDGEHLKEEIRSKMKHLTQKFSDQIMAIEEKGERSGELLASIQSYVNTAYGIKLAQEYELLKNEVTELQQSEIDLSVWDAFELQTITAELEISVEFVEYRVTSQLSEGSPPMVAKHPEIKHLHKYEKKENHCRRLSFKPIDVENMDLKDLITAYFYDIRTSDLFTVELEGGQWSRQNNINLPNTIYQLLPYTSETIMVKGLWSGSDSFDVCTLDCQCTYHTYEGDTVKWNYKYKMVAVTSDNKLILLNMKAQIMHIVSIENREMTSINLAQMEVYDAYGIMVSTDGNIIISCNATEGQKIIKYDLKRQQADWSSQSLIEQDKCIRLRMMGYRNMLYIIKSHQPTKVWILSLCHGQPIGEIQFNQTITYIRDISMRGDKFAVASPGGIDIFQITDSIYI